MQGKITLLAFILGTSVISCSCQELDDGQVPDHKISNPFSLKERFRRALIMNESYHREKRQIFRLPHGTKVEVR